MPTSLACQVGNTAPLCLIRADLLEFSRMITSSMDYRHSPEEVQSLGLLKELQKALSDAINSLDDQAPPPATVDCQYLQTAATSVNRAADGYLLLREAYRVDSSKLLVRPALEAVFAASAVMKKPGFLTRKAISEWEEEQMMFKHQDAAAQAAARQEFEDFKVNFIRDNPNYPADWRPVCVRKTAEDAQMEHIYNTTYRTYCKFTHGALGAVHGGLNEATNSKDTSIVNCCVMIMLGLLKQYTPAHVPNLESFRKRM